MVTIQRRTQKDRSARERGERCDHRFFRERRASRHLQSASLRVALLHTPTCTLKRHAHAHVDTMMTRRHRARGTYANRRRRCRAAFAYLHEQNSICRHVRSCKRRAGHTHTATRKKERAQARHMRDSVAWKCNASLFLSLKLPSLFPWKPERCSPVTCAEGDELQLQQLTSRKQRVEVNLVDLVFRRKNMDESTHKCVLQTLTKTTKNSFLRTAKRRNLNIMSVVVLVF